MTFLKSLFYFTPEDEFAGYVRSNNLHGTKRVYVY